MGDVVRWKRLATSSHLRGRELDRVPVGGHVYCNDAVAHHMVRDCLVSGPRFTFVEALSMEMASEHARVR
jgi:hypothetical protein